MQIALKPREWQGGAAAANHTRRRRVHPHARGREKRPGEVQRHTGRAIGVLQREQHLHEANHYYCTAPCLTSAGASIGMQRGCQHEPLNSAALASSTARGFVGSFGRLPLGPLSTAAVD